VKVYQIFLTLRQVGRQECRDGMCWPVTGSLPLHPSFGESISMPSTLNFETRPSIKPAISRPLLSSMHRFQMRVKSPQIWPLPSTQLALETSFGDQKSDSPLAFPMVAAMQTGCTRHARSGWFNSVLAKLNKFGILK